MSENELESKKSELTGLGGWLIFVGIGVIISPFIFFFFLITTYVPIFSDGSIALLTTKGSEHYVPGYSLLLFFELLSNLVIFFGSVYLMACFLSKSKYFPIHFIYLRLFTIVFFTLDIFLAYIMFPSVVSIFNYETMEPLLNSISVAVIWVPYMLYSKRVKNTFVN